VSINNFAFDPPVLTVTVGTTVTWTNLQDVPHTTTSDTNEWNSGNLAPGASFSHNFATEGTFTYHCTIHPNMTGTIVVTK
jgi:plastocyanin